MSWQRDPEWDAASFLLDTPLIADGTSHFVDAGARRIDFPGLRRAARPWSPSERLLVEAAWQLWSGEGKLCLCELTGSLDDANFERVIAAMRIRRGRLPLHAVSGGE